MACKKVVGVILIQRRMPMRNFKNFMKNEPAHHEPIKSNIWEEDPHTHISTTLLLEEIRQDL